jgi:peptidoglycan/LPS O-acetylase OafA/YrhL
MTNDTPVPPALVAGLERPNSDFRPELDFMRALAVLMVVFDHTALALHIAMPFGLSPGWLGTIGVWIFFVHTTLVLMWSLQRKPYTLDFYIRRIFRIYPLALFAIGVAVLTRAPLTGTIDQFFQYHRITLGNLVATSLLLYNLAPVHLHYHPIVNVIWTLPLEVEMYLLLPLLFAFAYRIRTRWPLVLLWLLACLVVHSIGLSGSLNLPSAIPCFLPGVIAYLGYSTISRRLPPWLFPLWLLLLVVVVLLHPEVAIGWIFALLLGFTLPYFRAFKPSLVTKLWHHLAKYSYGIYLSHPFGLLLGCYLLKGRPLALQLTMELVTIVVASVAGYHLIESPMIRLGSRLAARVEVRALDGDALVPDHALVATSRF